MISPNIPRTPPRRKHSQKMSSHCAPTTGNKATQAGRQAASELGKRFQPRPQSTHPDVLVLSHKAVLIPPATL